MKFITQIELDERLAEAKDKIATDTYLLQLNLSDYTGYLQAQAAKLKQLQKMVVLGDNTPLRSCINTALFTILAGSIDVLKRNGIAKPLHTITLKEFTQLPASELTKFFGITGNHIHAIKKIVKQANLKFK